MTDPDLSPEALAADMRDLCGYTLRAHVTHQSGAGTEAPVVIFADADATPDDGSFALHMDAKRANEPAIVYVRADTITALRARLAEAEAERDRLRAVWWHQMQSEAMKEMLATALALVEWKARAEAAEAAVERAARLALEKAHAECVMTANAMDHDQRHGGAMDCADAVADLNCSEAIAAIAAEAKGGD